MAHARCAPRSVARAPSLRCLRRLRHLRGCPFESHPHRTAPAPHASPASSLAVFASLDRQRLPRAVGSRPFGPLTGARHRLPFISTRRRHSRLFKYDIAAADLRYPLPKSLVATSVLTVIAVENITYRAFKQTLIFLFFLGCGR